MKSDSKVIRIEEYRKRAGIQSGKDDGENSFESLTPEMVERIALRLCIRLNIDPDDRGCAILLSSNTADTNLTAIVGWLHRGFAAGEYDFDSSLDSELVRTLTRETLGGDF